MTRPRVAVGIPTLNGSDRLGRLLASIRDCTDLDGMGAKLVVSDDGSTEENRAAGAALAAEYGADFLVSEQNMGIPRQWNRLARHTDARYVVLVNDDVEVAPDWLDALVFTLERNPHLGMIGLPAETGIQRAAAAPRPNLDYAEARVLDGSGRLLSSGGACFAFRRADWIAVGGFDERYFCYYEELDFGVALGKRGKFSAILSYPAVYHLVGATISTNLDPPKLLSESRAAFWKKWGQTLDEIREEFGRRERRPYVEWNSQEKHWRHP